MPAAPRDRLITSTIELIRRRGVAGTGVADLVEHSGAARRSLYQCFPGGKAELMAVAVGRAADRIGGLIRQVSAQTTPEEAVRAYIAYWTQLITEGGFQAGCPIAAAAYGGHDAPAARATAGRAFTAWSDLLVTQLTARGLATAAARALATTIIAAVEGAILVAVATESTEPLTQVGDQLVTLIRSQLPDTGK
ncbi:TetR/AcrR family transcriptional regulator [Nocardia stercoris]|uniref:TetR/AcrR family transcriptional regulator n=1 Tax=Nocardia stercoris TaxID=2483361 RepID=A0A3M2LD23_9NOCA|nr:TetR family transcriptional regulator [Nocardia stercoris]RMI34996.1 TetR/AcrR family transcriptional regulator [Nocardia stercoris]